MCDESISIILPVYNVQAYLQECIDSILAQTYQDFELVAIDDGSTDSSPLMLDAIANRYARVRVVHQANRGLSAARNTGIDIARGSYLLFVDSDDYIHSTMLERLVSTARETGSSIVMSDYYWVVGDAITPAGELHSFDGRIEERAYWQSEPRVDACGFMWNKLFKREVFSTARFTEGVCYEDTVIGFDVIDGNGPIAVIDEPLYYHRARRGSITDIDAPGIKLPACNAYVQRDEAFRLRGWADVRAYNLSSLVNRLTDVYVQLEDISSEERQEYDRLRRKAKDIFSEVWPLVLRNSFLAARVVPFMLHERLRVGLSASYWRRGIRNLRRKIAVRTGGSA